jgi:hypothetical protein
LAFFFVAQRAFVSTEAIFAKACGISATMRQSCRTDTGGGGSSVKRTENHTPIRIVSRSARDIGSGRQRRGSRNAKGVCGPMRRAEESAKLILGWGNAGETKRCSCDEGCSGSNFQSGGTIEW